MGPGHACWGLLGLLAALAAGGGAAPTQDQPQPADVLNSDIAEDKRAWQNLQGGWGKRGWQDMNNAWGKRGWQDMNSAWGKRGWQDMNSAWGKRGWQDMNNAWGKRSVPGDEAKRGWKDMNSAWGKRGWQDMNAAWGKRGWQDMNSAWGKRAWNNLHGNWGKRAWNNLQGGWGKRDTADLSDLLDEQDVEAAMEQYPPLRQILSNNGETAMNEADNQQDLDKRNWSSLHGTWGKRSVPSGQISMPSKREPGWNNLKQIWGKRSLVDDVYEAQNEFPDRRDE